MGREEGSWAGTAQCFHTVSTQYSSKSDRDLDRDYTPRLARVPQASQAKE